MRTIQSHFTLSNRYDDNSKQGKINSSGITQHKLGGAGNAYFSISIKIGHLQSLWEKGKARNYKHTTQIVQFTGKGKKFWTFKCEYNAKHVII